MQLLTPTGAKPYALGQLVTITTRGERLPGTVIEVRPDRPGRWAVRAEVLVSFGVGVSHHLVDDLGREVGSPTASLRPAEPLAISPVEEVASV